MQTRYLGTTGIAVSVIGLGTVKFGRNQGVKYPQAFELPSTHALADLLACSKELGINFLDTAPAYGSSEERLGELLRGQRQAWVLSTKVGEEFVAGHSHFDFSPQAITRSIERSLKRLATDYLDILLVHSNGDDSRLIEEERVFDTLSKLKESGKIRAYGMSSKTVNGGLMTIAQSDVAMVTYNPLQTTEYDVITTAAREQKGILVKKALASGHLQQFTLKQAIDFVFAANGVTSVVIGTINVKHLKEVCSFLSMI